MSPQVLWRVATLSRTPLNLWPPGAPRGTHRTCGQPVDDMLPSKLVRSRQGPGKPSRHRTEPLLLNMCSPGRPGQQPLPQAGVGHCHTHSGHRPAPLRQEGGSMSWVGGWGARWGGIETQRGLRAGPSLRERVRPWAHTGQGTLRATWAVTALRPLLWGGGRWSLLPLQGRGAEVGTGWHPGPSQTGLDVQRSPCSEKGRGQAPGAPSQEPPSPPKASRAGRWLLAMAGSSFGQATLGSSH